MTTIYHIQSTKPRSETGARPESVFFAWFVVKGAGMHRMPGDLYLSNIRAWNTYHAHVWSKDSHLLLFKECIREALSTYGDEPCAAIRKKISRLGRVCAQEAPDLPTLLDNAGFSFSVLEL